MYRFRFGDISETVRIHGLYIVRTASFCSCSSYGGCYGFVRLQIGLLEPDLPAGVSGLIVGLHHRRRIDDFLNSANTLHGIANVHMIFSFF